MSIVKAYFDNEAAIKRYLRRFVRRSEDIDDLAHESFLRAYAAEALQPINSPKAFLFKVARNLALNERAKLANATTDSLEDYPEQAVIAGTEQVTLDDEMDARQRVRLLAQAIASLPPQCSKVFLLRKIHGLSHKEIADRLGISVSTVEKHVALGLLRCSDFLRKQGYETGRPPVRPAAATGQVEKLEARRQARVRDA
ncbi:MAG TPA: RNA polymerase sigma factor [Rhizomicrobium sp.]|nr:RNA polymerase sigma factor [Rhizomicrobium sp.]